MASILILLHPEKPVSAFEFSGYLNSLSIRAFDVSSANAESITPSNPGTLIGQAQYLPLNPANTRIYQHFFYEWIGSAWIPVLQSVATAVIEINLPVGYKEYKANDIRLEITRGANKIADRSINYNVDTSTIPLPVLPIDVLAPIAIPYDFFGVVVSEYVTLHSPATDLDAASGYIALSEDGTPPNFADLLTAVTKVLNADPGIAVVTPQVLKDLSFKQCKNIAYELIWNRTINPLPVPDVGIDFMYTVPIAPGFGSSDDIERQRNRFEATLKSYRSINNANAEKLAGYVFSLCAAEACFLITQSSMAVGFDFPVLPTDPSNAAAIKQAEVILDLAGSGVLFTVPAEYFYALAATMPNQITVEQRYILATGKNTEQQTLESFQRAIDTLVIDTTVLPVNAAQASRRLLALGSAKNKAAGFVLATDPGIVALVTKWLGWVPVAPAPEDIAVFWQRAVGNIPAGNLDFSAASVTAHLNLVLIALTGADGLLKARILAIPVVSADDLAHHTTDQTWTNLFMANPVLLPVFAGPGSIADRIAAFIRYLNKFFQVQVTVKLTLPFASDAPELLPLSASDPIQRFVTAYQVRSGGAFIFGMPLNNGFLTLALNDVFNAVTEADANAWLEQAVRSINDLFIITNIAGAAAIQFSLIEALYARGFTDSGSISAFDLSDFTDALIGTVAYDFAGQIYTNAGGLNIVPVAPGANFEPVNPGCLVNCIPPAYRSPLGPVAYLHDVLKLFIESTCENLHPAITTSSIEDLVAARRGKVGDLDVSHANLEVQIPRMDLVNECLEAMASITPCAAPGVVYQTDGDHLRDHKLIRCCPEDKGNGIAEHDPELIYAAIPAYSSPATPVQMLAGYEKLKKDFSSCCLPYSQPLDINREYLKQMGTNRFETMRRFRKDITEFVIDPNQEPANFQKHLWRYPVRINIAYEYLGINPEEYDMLFTHDISFISPPPAGRLLIWELYGFDSKGSGVKEWTKTVVILSEFLKRTCLTYCEFIELWKSEFVHFHRAGANKEFPDCEPCCLDSLLIEFDVPDPNEPLKRLAVFIRLWKKLQHVEGARYSFIQLTDISTILVLFDAAGNINPDFIRQLSAFQMLRDNGRLPLTDHRMENIVPGVFGADRTHFLSIWAVPFAAKRQWAIEQLLTHIQYRAEQKFGCEKRSWEFIKLLMDNLDPLSKLAGFDPAIAANTWFFRPSATLRFVEILSKIYASDFSVGEILFLFTNDMHLEGDDPFPMQDVNEALDSPLDMPEDDHEFSLWKLRRKLLEVTVTEEEISSWTWTKMEATLKEDFDYQFAAVGVDPWQSLGTHFFPTVLESTGQVIDIKSTQYRVHLSLPSNAAMWNTPHTGPFHYDNLTQELWIQLPFKDEAIIEKIAAIRQLTASEQDGVRDLYYMPRVDLVSFSFLFHNFTRSLLYLIEEKDEEKRWKHFQEEFAYCYARCKVIADHLEQHVTEVSNKKIAHGNKLAWRLCQHLYADENKSLTSWESDNGITPAVTWDNRPMGGAFSALLGLTGTGLLGKFSIKNEEDVWTEVNGFMNVFSHHKNKYNHPLPTIIPSLEAVPQQQLLTIKNGFAIADNDGLSIGGFTEFTVQWRGDLLVEESGKYRFYAGAPTKENEIPDFDHARHSRWRISLKRGQKLCVLLSHNWHIEADEAVCTELVHLKRGVYQLHIDFKQPEPPFEIQEEVRPVHTGFQLKYEGPDTGDRKITIPVNKLFREIKDGAFETNKKFIKGTAAIFLAKYYTSTLRDIRRSYQRAFKSLLFAQGFGLSAKSLKKYEQSEIGYMLNNPSGFSGYSYFFDGGAYKSHQAYFDFNLLPVADNYFSPPAIDDIRVQPSLKRKQSLFDWWERIFDYCRVRKETSFSRDRPLWLLFAEAAEIQPDLPTELVRHEGVDIRHAPLVVRYFQAFDVQSSDLTDDRWAVRVWHSDKWVRMLMQSFLAKDITAAKPDLWASDDPGVSGNDNLTSFYEDGCIENDAPRRYEDIKKLNDNLRKNARCALLAYLCNMNRVALPWGGTATSAKDLSALLLMDVECGICERSSRIDEAINAIQLFVSRWRLGLEPTLVNIPVAFLKMWESRFVSYHVWQACRRREIYRENWISWHELKIGRQSQAFRFMEDRLRSATVTIPVPGGLEYWPDSELPDFCGLTALQVRETSHINGLAPQLLPSQTPEGFDLLGTPERHARNSWLASIKKETVTKVPQVPPGPNEPGPNDPTVPPLRRGRAVRAAIENIANNPGIPDDPTIAASMNILPLWVKAAIRLGTRFIRVAAASEPPASSRFKPHHRVKDENGCCADCCCNICTEVEEYYFWLVDSRRFSAQAQDADWGFDPTVIGSQSDWEDPNKLPGLLNWKSEPTVYIAWCRIQNGEFMQPRRSDEGIQVDPSTPTLGGLPPQLQFLSRDGDSLKFEVIGGLSPTGYTGKDKPGFRYDIVPDAVTLLPLVTDIVTPPPVFPGGLSAYPYFVYFCPGAPLVPPTLYAPAIAIADCLRIHCKYEAALKWYELIVNPLKNDCSWIPCTTRVVTNTNVRSVVVPKTTCCSSVPVTDDKVRQRSVLLFYIETLLQYGDAIMRKNSIENFQKARLVFDTISMLLGKHPLSVKDHTDPVPAQTVDTFIPDCAPLNPRLLNLYDLVSDRLALIHHCMNSKRLKYSDCCDTAIWGNDPVREGWKTDSCSCDDSWCCPSTPYRFMFLIQKAHEITADVRSLGAALLSAYEKGDAEFLVSMRSTHERQLLNLTLEIRQNQWRQADWQVQALNKSKESAQTRWAYYDNLITTGLISGEQQYVSNTDVNMSAKAAAVSLDGVAEMMSLIPDFSFGAAGVMGSPLEFNHLPLGTKLAGVFSTSARMSSTTGDIAGIGGSLDLTESGWDRRLTEWIYQRDIASIDIEQIERQIMAAERAKDIALRELNNFEIQREQTAEVNDFLRDKFTNHALYLNLQQETAALYFQMYELAFCAATQAERAFNFERGFASKKFLPEKCWDNLHDGLMTGEQLHLCLRQMEKSYLDENIREYELTKHFSLRMMFPLAFLKLKEEGRCEIEIPEWLFDLDYPGQYMRRIKNITVTIPCVVGPYTGVHCRLTLLCANTRVEPRLMVPPADCCTCDHDENGYSYFPDDPRIVKQFSALEAIATSTGQNDAGLFELNFRDERYLPFEFMGAVSRWRIELPAENNYFDMESLSDLVLHINFTTREGGEVLRKAANRQAQQKLHEKNSRLFDIRYEFPNAWYQFQDSSQKHEERKRELKLKLRRNMFPFMPGKKELLIDSFEIFFEAHCEEPINHHTLEFAMAQLNRVRPDGCIDYCLKDIKCVKGTSWPNLYHGSVSNINWGPLEYEREQELGIFCFPESIGFVSKAFILFKYRVHNAKKIIQIEPYIS